MSAEKTYEATVKSTKKSVTVYKHRTRGYVDFADCKTEYSEAELIIKK
jgi:hypothetical protein